MQKNTYGESTCILNLPVSTFRKLTVIPSEGSAFVSKMPPPLQLCEGQFIARGHSPRFMASIN